MGEQPRSIQEVEALAAKVRITLTPGVTRRRRSGGSTPAQVEREASKPNGANKAGCGLTSSTAGIGFYSLSRSRRR
jgi:hypothetical protein